ncbi:sugar phosphate isomerase/epimerase [Gemmata sp. JC673]|uniref:Sugar phosphate isomerase/epimerase n=1 Tax=Gemmata algarum TaxID=2975278 RepID=A0ABU5F551_9BACT|nr:sugar phosphate isomerase/epimerase family protein [Gemmata algarum]MDY3562486.1 sugar phosphate isomerase/epimerase [Gemmata algarum]
MSLTRRELLCAAGALPFVCGAAAPKVPLGFSLYGMKSVALPEALKVCRTVGYDGVELALMPGYHAEPKALSANDRKELRARLADLGLSVHGLMENLQEPAADPAHKANLERLKAATELAHSLAPDAPPPIETVLGGKPAEWDKVRAQLAERLGAWAELGQSTRTVIAVKPHVANALHTVEGAVWLMKQVNSPWLRLAFDYSHFELRGLPLERTGALLPYTAFVHVKDAKGKPEKFEFLLPGEGTTDYSALAKLLTTAKYAGPVVVEVSGQVSNKPGYDAASAAKRSFAAIGAAFARDLKK